MTTTTETETCNEQLPKGVTISRAFITGQPIATCENCDYKCAYWDCACDLIHECEEN